MENVKWKEPRLPQLRLTLTWFGHASFSFVDENGNKIYYVDPFDLPAGRQGLTYKPLEKADLVFITHAHSDHFSPKDLEKILKPETIIIATPDVLEKIQRDEILKQPVEPNKDYEVKGFKFSTIPAYNTNPEKLSFHPKSNNWVGYIFSLNGKKIYHSGDTDFIEEMKSLKDLNLDIAILPIGGTYTMDAKEAALAANTICAKTTIPMHYKNLLGEKYPEAEGKFRNLVKNSKVVILEELR